LFIGYRTARAALNQQTVTLAQDYKKGGDNIITMALNPGWFPTRLTVFKGIVDLDDSVQNMVTTIGRVGPEGTGQFFDWTGEKLPF